MSIVVLVLGSIGLTFKDAYENVSQLIDTHLNPWLIFVFSIITRWAKKVSYFMNLEIMNLLCACNSQTHKKNQITKQAAVRKLK